MSHVFQVPDEAYQAMKIVAAAHGQTPEAFFQAWVAAIQKQAHKQRGTVYDPDQVWFWTPEWQAGERQADADKAAGRSRIFYSEEEFFRSLGADEELLHSLEAVEESRPDADL